MNISRLTRATQISRTQLQEVSHCLIAELSEHLHVDLKCFKRHIVEGESCVSTVQGGIQLSESLDFRFEGVVLIQMRTSKPPSVDAELLVFSRGERIGLHRQEGASFLRLHYRMDGGAAIWETQGWFGDGPDDWERQTRLRSSLYDSLNDTWEAND
jgi:hypothetical protein